MSSIVQAEKSRFISFAEVQSRTGSLSKATYWRLRRKHLFPDPVVVRFGTEGLARKRNQRVDCF